MPISKKLIAGLAALAAAGAFQGAAFAQEGYFTADQAARGQTLYNSNCGGCHGTQLEGGDGPTLRGIDFLGNWGTAGGIFDYFSVSMPPQSPGKLGEDVYVDILAYIMSANGIPAGDKVLPVGDHAALEAINLTQAAASASAAPAGEASTPVETGAPVPQAFTFGKPLPTLMPDGQVQEVTAGSAAANP